MFCCVLDEEGGDCFAGAAPFCVGLEGDVGVSFNEGVKLVFGFDFDDRHFGGFFCSYFEYMCLVSEV